MINKRIGTITTGLFMIVLGILLLASIAIDISLGLTLMKFWPLFLISLGLEVLYHHYRAGKEGKLRYDLVSMFILFLFGTSAIGLFVFQTSGILGIVNELSKSSTYTVDISRQKIPVGATTDRVVIENSSGDFLTIKVEDRDDVTVNGSISIVASSRNKARQLVNENRKFTVDKQGNKMIIRTYPVYIGKWFLKGTTESAPLTVSIPSHLALDVVSTYGDTSIMADKIEKDWFIRQNEGILDVTLPDDASANIVANARQVEGSLKFGSQDINSSPNSTNEDTTTVNSGSQLEIPSKEYSATLGKGGPLLRLVNPHGGVEVFIKNNGLPKH